MEREERQHLRGVVEEVSGWRKLAVGIVEEREPVEAAAEDAARLSGPGPPPHGAYCRSRRPMSTW
jgi:hypothetical protein